MDNVAKIKDRLDIVDLVGSYISLTKTGENFKGKCPFHNEKTASFFVSPVRQSFYCFGCGVGGDIFSFIEKYEGHDFKSALVVLAEKAGVTLERNDADRDGQDEKGELLEVLEEATRFFEENLAQNTDAMLYLKERGLEEKTIHSFRIGFAKASWDSLLTHLKEKGFSEEIAFRAGLLKKKDARFYDTFRSRIIFPITDRGGKVIAFSGRIFKEESEAKYLNSPETAVFIKSESLFGFDKARTEIRKRDYCILVEGQFDLVMAHQSGFINCVASSGTAFGERGLMHIGRLSKNLLLIFDADAAGIAASGRVAKIALPHGFNVKCALLPKGSDPAEVLQNDPNVFKESIKNSKHVIDFYVDLLEKAKYDERKFSLEIRRIVLPYVALLENKLDQAYFVRKIAEKVRAPEIAVWGELSKVEKSPAVKSLTDEQKNITSSLDLDSLVINLKFYLDSKDKKELSTRLLQRYEEITGKTFPNKEELKDQRALFEIEALVESADIEKLASEIVDRLEIKVLTNRLEESTALLKEKENAGEEEAAAQYLSTVKDLGKRLQELKNIKT